MNNLLTVHLEEKPIYNIQLEESYQNLFSAFSNLNTERRKICIVSDSNVSQHYLNQTAELLSSYAIEINTFVFPAGEDSKTLDTVKKLYEYLILKKYDRNDILVALGGGVVGDLTGYTAATYLRGIRFVQLPTSLLSMVDSSIGGKTGVDFDSYKNMVGAFHQPKAVYINLSTLFTLTDKQYYSGFGEIIKHGLIKDKDYYDWIKANIESIKEKKTDVLAELVYRSCLIKKNVVDKDAYEAGERALLNFGHTIGHAVEKLMNFKLLHGECVAVGMAAASYISYKKGNITKIELDDIVTTIREFCLPVKISALNKEDILEATKHDKKMESSKIKFILLEEVGNAVINLNVTDSEILDAIDYIMD